MSVVHETWVMPIAPIRAAEGVEYDAARGVEFAVTDLAAGIDPDGETVTLSATNWVEVPEPIVWDGSDEARQAIATMLAPTTFTLYQFKAETWIEIDEVEIDQLKLGDSVTVVGTLPYVIRRPD